MQATRQLLPNYSFISCRKTCSLVWVRVTQIILHPFSIYYCPFFTVWTFSSHESPLPFKPLLQSLNASLVRISWHLIHVISSLFWVSAWRGFALLWHGYPCLDDECQLTLHAKMPCSADKRSWQRARQNLPGEVAWASSRESSYLHGTILISGRWTQEEFSASSHREAGVWHLEMRAGFPV